MAFLMGILNSEKIREDSPSELKTSTNQAFIPLDRDRRFRNVTGDSGQNQKSVTIKTETSVTFVRKSRSPWSGIRKIGRTPKVGQTRAQNEEPLPYSDRGFSIKPK